MHIWRTLLRPIASVLCAVFGWIFRSSIKHALTSQPLESEALTNVDDLRGALRALVQDLCGALVGVELPVRSWTKVVRNSDGSFQFPSESRPDPTPVLFNLFRTISKSSNFDQLFRIVEADQSLAGKLLADAVGQPLSEEAQKRNWLENAVTSFVSVYFRRAETFHFDELRFDELFDREQVFLETGQATVTAVSPLLNLTVAQGPVELEPGLRIREVTADEVEQWINPGSPWFSGMFDQPLTQNEVMRLAWAIEQQVAVTGKEKFSNEADISAQEAAWRVVDLLRLVTDATVYLPYTETHWNAVFRMGGAATGRMFRLATLRLPFGAGTLDEALANQLCDLWRKWPRSPNKDRASLAVRRWVGTAERLSNEDKLIDYWVGLESLFMPDTTQELSFRASLRIAGFLGETATERRQIYSDMRHSYSWRSALVHGGDPSRQKELNKKLDIVETTARTRAHCRSALLRFLESDKAIDPTAIELDLLGGR